jgi:hypothetical protein
MSDQPSVNATAVANAKASRLFHATIPIFTKFLYRGYPPY